MLIEFIIHYFAYPASFIPFIYHIVSRSPLSSSSPACPKTIMHCIALLGEDINLHLIENMMESIELTSINKI